jgi:hypothetical protein
MVLLLQRADYIINARVGKLNAAFAIREQYVVMHGSPE